MPRRSRGRFTSAQHESPKASKPNRKSEQYNSNDATDRSTPTLGGTWELR